MSNRPEPSIADDFVLPFQVGDTAVRGRVVRLSASIHQILSAHEFPNALSELVGEAGFARNAYGRCVEI